MKITEDIARFRMEQPVLRRTYADEIVRIKNYCNPFPHGGPLWTRTKIVLENAGKTVAEIRRLIHEAGWPKINGTVKTLRKIGIVHY